MKSMRNLFIILSATLLAQGCTALLWSANPAVEEVESSKQTQLEDKIFAIGKNQQAQATIAAGTVLIIGQKNIYVLNKGSEKLFEIYKNIPDRKYLSPSLESTLEFRLNDANAFSGAVTFSYLKQTPIDDSEWDILLNKLGFQKQNDKLATIYLSISGKIHPHADANQSQQAASKFRQSYPVLFYKTKRITQVNPDNIIENAVMTPVSLAGDMILLPLMFLGSE